jgi:pentatricopeptide repeat protein
MILNYNNPYEKSELSSKTLLDLVKCGDADEQLKDYMFRRDFVWATINVINYLVKDKKLEEAEEILEDIQSCRGFCYGTELVPNSSRTKKSSTCGCNR